MICTNCGAFSKCTNKNKSTSYTCSKWEPIKVLETDYVSRLFSGELQSSADARDALSDLSLDVRNGSIEHETKERSLIARSYIGAHPETDADNSNELDLTSYLEEILRPDRTVLADLRVDDRDLREAKNFYEFCFSESNVGLTTPFARQLFMGIHLFHEYCRPCSRNKAALDNILSIPIDQPMFIPENFQLLEFGKCPKCSRTKLDLLKSGNLKFYNELAILLGQRSGKSTATALFAAYITHKFLKLQKPTEVYGKGVASNTVLTGTFVGLRFKDAMDLLWSPYNHIITEAAWFREYESMLTYYGNKFGEELFKHMDTFVEYRHRNLFIYPSGPSKKTLRGRTRIFSAIDELDYFDFAEGSDTKERTSAKEVYNALDRSLLTIRALARKQVKAGNYNIPTAYGFNLSSPASYFGFLTSLVRSHVGNSKTVLAYNLATWEVNPTITEKDLEKEFKDNPIKAWQDYGAVPPKSVNSFFLNVPAIKSCFQDHLKNIVYETVIRPTAQESVKVSKIRRVPGFGIIPPSVLALDAGFSNNSFAAMTASINPNKTSTMKVHISAAVEVIPEPAKGIVVDYATIDEDMIHQLIEEKNVQVVLADRWNSLSILHRLRDKYPHVEIIQYRMKYPDFVAVRSYVDSVSVGMPQVELPFNEIENLTFSESYPVCFDNKPMAHLYIQLLTVRDAVKTITKADKLTDDLFRCFALCICKLTDEDFVKKYMRSSLNRAGKAAPVVSAGRSSGSITNYTKTPNAQQSSGNPAQTILSSSGKAIIAKR